MKKRIVILLLSAFVFTTYVFSQTTENEKKVETKIEGKIKVDEKLMYDHTKEKIDLMYNINRVNLKSIPTLADFSRFQQTAISRRFSFVGNGKEVTYLGMGKYFSINGAIRWKVSDKLSLDAGGLFSRQFYFSGPITRQDVMGMNVKGQYALNDYIRLEIWGQYIFPNETYSYSSYNSLFPHTGIGTSVSIDLKENTGIKVGAEYQYDRKTQKWGLESTGKVSIGF